MSKSKSLPSHVLRVRTYEELRRYATAFATGHLNLLLVFGDPGLGKSRCIRQSVSGTACWIDGNASPFGIYIKAFQHKDQPVVLDDVDDLYRDKAGVRLLKSLCQTEPVKSVSWQTDVATLRCRNIPQQFNTSSRVAIIANEWKSLNANVAALEDRGHLISFEPSPLEIHEQAATWFWDQEIFDFIGSRLGIMAQPSLRMYVLAYEAKQANLDWKTPVLSRCLQGTALEVALLKANDSFASEEERVEAFVDQDHGCRATYFNHAKQLRQSTPAPAIKLANTEPPQYEPPLADIEQILRQRKGRIGNG